MAKLISKTYGDALFETALDTGKVDGLFEEAAFVGRVLDENPELLKLLHHPNIIKEEKLKVMESVFEGNVSSEMTGFLRVVIEKDRESELPAILDWFIDRVKEYKHIGKASVTSASELSEDQKKQIEKRLLETTAYESIEMTFSVDESLIGGLVIRIGDRVVDSSIKTKLYEMKRELMKIQLA